MKQITTFFTAFLLAFSASAIPYLTGYSTNMVLQIVSDNTNLLEVYDIGDTALRGQYFYEDTDVNAISRYTNNSGNGVSIAFDPLGNVFLAVFSMTNGAGSVRYQSSGSLLNQPSLLPQPFFHVAGSLPNGTITWGTNFTPVVFPQFIAVPLNVPMPLVQSNYWYVRTNGNDLTASRGRIDLPAATLHRVFTNATPGDVVFVGAGHFTNDFGTDSSSQFPAPQFPANYVVKGAGVGITFMDGKIDSSQWQLGNSNVISDFTATNVWFYDNIFKVITNIEIHDIEAIAHGDVIVFQGGVAGMVSLWNLRLGGNSDKIADLTSPTPATQYITNTIIDLANITIVGGPGAVDGAPDGINSGGAMTWRGGGIHVNVTGAVYEEHILTNGIFGIGSGGYIFAPQLNRTNWIGGQLYTNLSSGWWEVKGVSVLTEAAVTGGAVQQLWVYNKSMLGGGLGTTNQHAQQTTATLSAGTNAITLSAWVPPGYVFAFTNQSGGAGNSAIVKDGQYFVP